MLHAKMQLGILKRKRTKIRPRQPMSFGFCRLVVAEPKELWERDDPSKWSWVRVATKYPVLTERYFSERGIQVEMVRLDGSIELAPLVGLADRIVELVHAGGGGRQGGRPPPPKYALPKAGHSGFGSPRRGPSARAVARGRRSRHPWPGGGDPLRRQGAGGCGPPGVHRALRPCAAPGARAGRHGCRVRRGRAGGGSKHARSPPVCGGAHRRGLPGRASPPPGGGGGPRRPARAAGAAAPPPR